jgi:hypothetical protein
MNWYTFTLMLPLGLGFSLLLAHTFYLVVQTKVGIVVCFQHNTYLLGVSCDYLALLLFVVIVYVVAKRQGALKAQSLSFVGSFIYTGFKLLWQVVGGFELFQSYNCLKTGKFDVIGVLILWILQCMTAISCAWYLLSTHQGLIVCTQGTNDTLRQEALEKMELEEKKFQIEFNKLVQTRNTAKVFSSPSEIREESVV